MGDDKLTFDVVGALIEKNGKYLVCKRKKEDSFSSLWEFPGGKIRAGESARAACIREIKEEVNLDVSIDRHIAKVKHAYTHFRIVMDVFCCKYVSGRVFLRGPVAFRWIRLDDYKKYPFPRANHKFIPLLQQGQCINRREER